MSLCLLSYWGGLLLTITISSFSLASGTWHPLLSKILAQSFITVVNWVSQLCSFLNACCLSDRSLYSSRWAMIFEHTSCKAQMIKYLNWRTLEQRRIDSRLTIMYKITYGLVAIPAADYLIPNTRQSRHNPQLAYRQIPSLKRLVQVHILSPHHSPLERPPILHPCLPTVAQFSRAVCQEVHVSP